MDWQFVTIITISTSMTISVVVAMIVFRLVSIRQRGHQRLIDKLNKDLSLLASSSAGVGRRLHQAEQRVGQIAEESSTLGMESNHEQKYQYALKLIEMGAEDREVAESSHLTLEEVELLRKMSSTS